MQENTSIPMQPFNPDDETSLLAYVKNQFEGFSFTHWEFTPCTDEPEWILATPTSRTDPDYSANFRIRISDGLIVWNQMNSARKHEDTFGPRIEGTPVQEKAAAAAAHAHRTMDNAVYSDWVIYETQHPDWFNLAPMVRPIHDGTQFLVRATDGLTLINAPAKGTIKDDIIYADHWDRTLREIENMNLTPEEIRTEIFTRARLGKNHLFDVSGMIATFVALLFVYPFILLLNTLSLIHFGFTRVFHPNRTITWKWEDYHDAGTPFAFILIPIGVILTLPLTLPLTIIGYLWSRTALGIHLLQFNRQHARQTVNENVG